MIDRSDNPSPASDDKAERIQQIITDVITRRADGERVEDSHVEQEHPELMPQLRERLRMLRGIEAAAEKARRPSSSRVDNSGSATGDQASLEYIESQLNGYRDLDPLSRGGQGIVYKAVQESTHRIVAIKVLREGPLASGQKRNRFAREVELISRLHHPNIVTLFDSGFAGHPHPFAYFAMEYVEGVPIDDHMLVERPPVSNIVRMLSVVCRALSYAHQRGIIHRDIKPSNILVDSDGQPRILDFGLAKEVEGDEPGSDVSAVSLPGQVVGTLQYLSPEQVGGEDLETDIRSDIYSLGVVLYHILTGVFPYPVTGRLDDVRSHIRSHEPAPLRKALASDGYGHFVDPTAIPDDLEAIVLKALRKEKERRYQSASGLADDLDRFLAGEAVSAKADSSFYVFRKNLRKYRVHVAIASAFFFLVVGAAIVTGLGWREARTQRDNVRQATGIVQSTLADVVGIINEEIEPLAGGLAVRGRLHDIVSEELVRLQALVEVDETLEVSSALRRNLGDIAYDQGRHDEARQNYLAALDIAKRGVETRPNDLDAHLELVRVHRQLGRVSTPADDSFARAIALAKAAIDRFPGDIRLKYELCMTCEKFALHLANSGRYREALKQAQYGLAVAEGPDVTGRDAARLSKVRASLYDFRGLAANQLGEGDRFHDSLKTAVVIREEMIQQRPSDMEVRLNLLISLKLLGGYYRDTGDFQRAEACLVRAVQLGHILDSVEPSNLTWTANYYGACNRLARLYCKLAENTDGDSSQADAHYSLARKYSELARTLADRLQKAEPANTQWRRLLGFSFELEGGLSFSTGQFESARASYLEALAIREKLVDDDPDNPALENELATTMGQLGKCAMKLRDDTGASQYLPAALERHETLLSRFPDVPEYAFDVVESRLDLADWHHANGEAQRALAQFAAAKTSLADLNEAGELEGFQDWHHDLTVRIDELEPILREAADGRPSTRPASFRIPGR